jgi:hypothetical protein
MKKTVVLMACSLLIVVFLTACKNEQESTAMHIVEQSIKAHGGLETWQNIKTLSFNKTTILFKKDGSIEKETNQKQSFELQPVFKGEISWEEDNNKYRISFDGEKVTKMINDSLVLFETELESAKNSIIAAHYVVNQPFKLLEKNTFLKNNGIKELDDKQVYAIDVSYTSDHETSDQWTYYFDIKTYQLLANKVIHKPTTSLIKNLDFNTDTRLMFNAHRKSYFLKASGDIDYLRAEYFYDSFKITY